MCVCEYFLSMFLIFESDENIVISRENRQSFLFFFCVGKKMSAAAKKGKKKKKGDETARVYLGRPGNNVRIFVCVCVYVVCCGLNVSQT